MRVQVLHPRILEQPLDDGLHLAPMHHLSIDQQVCGIEGPQRQQAPAQCGRNLALRSKRCVALSSTKIAWLARYGVSAGWCV
jgi:hypothetical protein